MQIGSRLKGNGEQQDKPVPSRYFKIKRARILSFYLVLLDSSSIKDRCGPAIFKIKSKTWIFNEVLFQKKKIIYKNLFIVKKDTDIRTKQKTVYKTWTKWIWESTTNSFPFYSTFSRVSFLCFLCSFSLNTNEQHFLLNFERCRRYYRLFLIRKKPTQYPGMDESHSTPKHKENSGRKTKKKIRKKGKIRRHY